MSRAGAVVPADTIVCTSQAYLLSKVWRSKSGDISANIDNEKCPFESMRVESIETVNGWRSTGNHGQ